MSQSSIIADWHSSLNQPKTKLNTLAMNPPLKIFVINLVQATARKKHVLRQLSKQQLNAEFIQAVDGNLLKQAQINQIYSKSKSLQSMKRPLTKGEIACAMSHLNIHQKMLDENIEQAVILEDDIILGDDFVATVEKIQAIAPKNWQLILLGYHPYSCNFTILKPSILPNTKLVVPLTLATGTHGYLINKAGAGRLLSTLKTLSMPIDWYTGNYRLTNLYAIKPPFVGVSPEFLSDLSQERNIVASKIQVKDLTSAKDILRKIFKTRMPESVFTLFKIIFYKFTCMITIIKYMLGKKLTNDK